MEVFVIVVARYAWGHRFCLCLGPLVSHLYELIYHGGHKAAEIDLSIDQLGVEWEALVRDLPPHICAYDPFFLLFELEHGHGGWGEPGWSGSTATSIVDVPRTRARSQTYTHREMSVFMPFNWKMLSWPTTKAAFLL